MRQKDHRRISDEVARKVAPEVDLSRLVAASGPYPDEDNRGDHGHHSLDNRNTVFELVRKARRELLHKGYSLDFQRSLGYALHYIQDLFAICTTASALQGDCLLLHNEIESKLSRYSDSIPYEGIASEGLEGEQEVRTFLRRSIDHVCKDPQHALEQPGEALEDCFRACLSVVDAVCNNEPGFAKGADAIHACEDIGQQLARLGDRLDAMPESVERAIERSGRHLEHVEYLSARYEPRKRSFIRQWFAPVSRDRERFQSQMQSQKRICEVWFTAELDKLREVEDWEKTLREAVSKPSVPTWVRQLRPGN